MAGLQTTKLRRDGRTTVFVTFESEFAPLGGLAAVMRILPRYMAKREKGGCLTLAPFFKYITRCNTKRMNLLTPTSYVFPVSFGKDVHQVRLFEYVDSAGFAMYLLDTDAFFNAPCDCGNPPSWDTPCNPYMNPANPDQLLQDALFFSAAVPRALVALGYTENLLLNLQDWQTACAAFTVKKDPEIVSARCVLTIHNPYDFPLPKDSPLGLFSDRAPTVLSAMMPFLDGPLCTVSENFALELVQDPLHTQVYAPHLQVAFREKGIVGVDNGLFAQLDFPEFAIAAGKQGDYGPLLAEKRRRREAMVQVLEAYQPAAAWGTLTGLGEFEGPIFLLFGRDDPRQKGYDVAAAAIRQLPPGAAKYIFTPIPGDEGLEGLRFLRVLAKERPGEVKVFPFRLEQGYREVQQGSSFLVMCSLYEPFGGATEGYAVGTPVVARATGGLVQQIAPYPGGTWSHAVRRRTDYFHPRNAPPTGILFREPDLDEANIIAGWRKIVACEYGPRGDRMQDRLGTPLFDAMVQEANWALQDAIDLYQHHRDGIPSQDYAQMIVNGFAMLSRFSWERAVRAYQRVYNAVS
ncbi:MAG: glycogen/starch synthase [Anaerolineae bacterium]|nr:glycogen/starch synthase [Anaerolineae bacterium]